MRSVTPPGCDAAAHLDAIIASKRQPVRAELLAMRPMLATQYGEFAARFDGSDVASYVAAAPLSDDQRRALLHCYTGSTAALTALKREIKGVAAPALRDICPYCGIGETRPFDHYLPKELFPELGVHPFNLIPCCATCNSLKVNIWLVGGKRQFFHCYLDRPPGRRFLDVSIVWRRSGRYTVPEATWSLVLGGVAPELAEIVRQHFRRMELLERYANRTPAVFDEAFSATRASNPQDAEGVESFMQSYLSLRRRTLGRSDWRLVLLNRLRTDARFVQLCTA